MEEDDNFEQSQIRCKLILVGDSYVGKTSIIARYIKKYQDNYPCTVSASFTTKLEIINGKQINFELWDTVGEEKYRSVNNIFYKEAQICLMVFDITNKKTFESIKNYWYKEIKNESCEHIIFHIAGNKIDLFENEQVTKDEVKAFCKQINCDFDYISAKENKFIDGLFQKLGEIYLNSDAYINFTNNQHNTIRVSVNTFQNNPEGSEKGGKGGKGCCSFL